MGTQQGALEIHPHKCRFVYSWVFVWIFNSLPRIRTIGFHQHQSGDCQLLEYRPIFVADARYIGTVGDGL